MTKYNLFIGIPVAHNIENECTQSIFNALAAGDPRIGEFKLHVQRGYLVDDNRNKIAKAAIDAGADLIVMIDSDTVIPTNAFGRLIDAMESDPNIMLAAGWQHRKNTYDGQTECFIEDGERNYIERYKGEEIKQFAERGELIDIKGSGFGLVMIRANVIREMFEKKMLPFKYVIYNPFDPGARLSEDNYFSGLVKRELGYRIVCVPDLMCGHIWKHIF